MNKPGLNIWRSKFDYRLAMKAKEAGAELIDETAVLSCSEKNDCVEVVLKGKHTYTETTKAVIVCDGAVSSVKRKLTNGSEKLYHCLSDVLQRHN